MKVLNTLLFMLILSVSTFAQTTQVHLLGVYNRDELLKNPYNEWFVKNYDAYTPDTELIAQLKSVKPNDYTLKIFTGTWCGDTHRELPRLLKILDAIQFNPKSLQLIGLNGVDSVYKQSPDGAEKGLNIYRVPTVVVYKKGVEVNRLVEFPVQSLEHDLLAIFSGMEYAPNYASYPYVTQWLNQGLLLNPNTSALGLANQIRYKVNGISELINCAYAFSCRGQIAEAIMLYRINTYIYSDNPVAYYRLAMAYKANKEYDKAAKMLEYAIRYDKNQENLKDFLEAYKETVGLDTKH